MADPSPHAINDRIAQFILGPGAIHALPGQLEAVMAQAAGDSLAETGVGGALEGMAGFRQRLNSPWTLRRFSNPYWVLEPFGTGPGHLSWDNRGQWGQLLPFRQTRGRWHGEHRYTYDFDQAQQWMSLGAQYGDLTLGIDHGVGRDTPHLYTVSGFAELDHGQASLRISTEIQRLEEDDIYTSEATLRVPLPGGLRGTLRLGQSDGPDGGSTTTEGTLSRRFSLPGDVSVRPYVTEGERTGAMPGKWSEQGVRGRVRLGAARLGLGVTHREEEGAAEIDDWQLRGSVSVPVGDGRLKGSVERGLDGNVQWMIRFEIPF